MKEKHGEIIDLMWDGKPFAYYIKGYVDKAEAAAIISNYLQIIGFVAEVRHIWAKWCFATEDDGVPEGCKFVFRTQSIESKGWFKVTEVIKH